MKEKEVNHSCSGEKVKVNGKVNGKGKEGERKGKKSEQKMRRLCVCVQS